jgi:hypothetical protein
MRRWLGTREQIAKLDEATRLADDASRSEDIVRRLGSFVLHAGIADFLAIQAARLVEQIVLKAQLAEGLAPSFQPHEDSYFYAKGISTRRILKGIRKLLPFTAGQPSAPARAQEITALAQAMVKMGLAFLDCRNPVVHQIGSPTRGLEELIALCDQANARYQEFLDAHRAFMEAAGPYRFSEKELRFFYPDDRAGNER